MKKLLSGVTGVFILMSILTGCGNAKDTANLSNQSPNAASSSGNQGTNTSNQEENKNTLLGEVTAIDDNKITLKVIENPRNEKGKNDGNQAQKQDNNNKQNKNNEKNASNSSGNTNGKSAEKNVDNATGKLKQDKTNNEPEIKYTGETKTVTIPDGITITALNSDGTGDGGKRKDITLKDIKIGDRLNIVYSGNDNTTISKVNVMNQSSK